MTEKKGSGFWTRTPVVILAAMICCLLWGSASPAIKTGYRLFGIGDHDIAARILFAGIRFTIAGLMVIIGYSAARRHFQRPRKGNFRYVFFLMMFQTILQYLFFYTALAHLSGVRGSVINAMTTFFSIFLAAFVFHFEKLTVSKAVGSILGFLGVLLIVTGGRMSTVSSGGVSLFGEGAMLAAAFTSAFSSCLIKKFGAKENPVILSGWQFLCGGLIMTAGAFLAGGRLHPAGPEAILLILYMGFISAGAYSLWGLLLKYNNVSRVTILGFMNPVFGVLLSALFLGEVKEAFSLVTVVSLLFVSAGIILSEHA